MGRGLKVALVTVNTGLPSLSWPSLTERISVTLALPASGSEMVIGFAPVKASWLGTVAVRTATVSGPAGRLITGGTLAAVTVSDTVDVVIWGTLVAPPGPVKPWSLVVTVSFACPWKLAGGVYSTVCRAALRLASVPLKVRVAAAVLLAPAVKVTAVLLTSRVP